MNILLLCTRSIEGHITGRKLVLKTIISSLSSLGYRVDRVIFSKNSEAMNMDTDSAEKIVHLPLPGYLRIAWNISFYFLRRKMSLNECLYFLPRNIRRLKKIAEQLGTQIVIADMIRTAPYAEAINLPWILDLDDLLSKRYSAMAGHRAPNDMILGYYSEYIPKALLGFYTKIADILLGREAVVIKKREAIHSRNADAVCTVSRAEARELSLRTGRTVFDMPMAVSTLGDTALNIKKRPMTMVFLGSLSFQQNLEAVRYYVNEILPAMKAEGLRGIQLHVIGYYPESVKRELKSENLELLGYIDEMHERLCTYQLFVAPIMSGTGIKSKVLEAMALGLPVLTTPKGVQGLDIVNGRHCYIFSSPEEFLRLLKQIESNPGEALNVSLAGRNYVEKNFSPEVVAQKWRNLIVSLTAD